ncbi:hypothetical protein CRENBAI_005636 [Crenichthys baileyi]|uniref:Uncharacterized protein n=1 Tax=Crenichthys baileyi TaxID=28760 RepID=A0AAV9QU31_9TELE
MTSSLTYAPRSPDCLGSPALLRSALTVESVSPPNDVCGARLIPLCPHLQRERERKRERFTKGAVYELLMQKYDSQGSEQGKQPRNYRSSLTASRRGDVKAHTPLVMLLHYVNPFIVEGHKVMEGDQGSRIQRKSTQLEGNDGQLTAAW